MVLWDRKNRLIGPGLGEGVVINSSDVEQIGGAPGDRSPSTQRRCIIGCDWNKSAPLYVLCTDGMYRNTDTDLRKPGVPTVRGLQNRQSRCLSFVRLHGIIVTVVNLLGFQQD